MSVLSTITSSLPNVLNLLQGKWSVEYKVAVKTAEDDKGMLAKARNMAISAQNFLNGRPDTKEKFEWKELDFDSFIDMQEIQDTSITSHPIEGGSFRSVNKVRKPKLVKVTLAKAGIGYGIEDSLAEVKMLLPLARYKGQQKSQYGINAVAQNIADFITGGIKKALGVKTVKKPAPNFPMEFRVLTPFDMIERLNLIKLDYTFKKDNGRNMLLMYLTFQEILERGSVTKTSYSIPTDAPKENVGRLSPTKG